MADMESLQFTLKLISVLGCGLIAGTFFAFSTFVMNALSRLSPAQGLAAMQSINIAVINPLFMGVFLGTGVASLLLLVSVLRGWNQPGAVYLLAGCLLYLVGTLMVTIVFNVPLNDSLAKVTSERAEGMKLWSSYLTNWTFWNHVRTLAAFAATASFAMALCARTAQ